MLCIQFCMQPLRHFACIIVSDDWCPLCQWASQDCMYAWINPTQQCQSHSTSAVQVAHSYIKAGAAAALLQASLSELHLFHSLYMTACMHGSCQHSSAHYILPLLCKWHIHASMQARYISLGAGVTSRSASSVTVRQGQIRPHCNAACIQLVPMPSPVLVFS